MKKWTIIYRPYRYVLHMMVALFLAIPPLQVTYYKYTKPRYSNLMLGKYLFGQSKVKLENKKKHWVSQDQVSVYFLLSTLIAEDHTFYNHVGVHFPGIGYAIDGLLKGKKRPPGASTITQQTAKNLFLYPKRSYFRKAIEIYYALLMEKIWDKDRILEMYLNIIEMGDGIYGIGQGAEKWLDKQASEICFDEACLLSSILSNPHKLLPDNPSNELKWRTSLLYRRGLYQASAQKNCPPLHAENFPFMIS